MPRVRWLDAKVPPLVVTTVFALAMWGAAALWPTWSFAWPVPEGVKTAVVAVLVITGMMIGGAGVVQFVRRGASVNPLRPDAADEIVSHGVYAYTRNPMYLGLVLVLVGEAVWLANVAAVLLSAAYVLYIDRFQIVPEERALRAKFGKAFETYAARVRRWI